MSTPTVYCYLDSPLGPLLARGDGRFVTGLFLPRHQGGPTPDHAWQLTRAPFTALRVQLAEYFAGRRRQFDVPLMLAGTPFQQRVWRQLLRIPCGATIEYAELAARLGRPTAVRAVGQANARNPVSILVPCHRVVGAAGQLTGYAGGIDKKQWLLAWERQLSPVAGESASGEPHFTGASRASAARA